MRGLWNRVNFAADDAGAGGGAGDQGAVGDAGSLGWRAALPDEYKEHEFVKPHGKPGDFVKAALEIKAERDALNTRLEGSIVKPGEGAKPEEISAYRKALGVPESPTEYEFPKTEGIEQDPKVIEWSRGIFHKFGIPKDAAAGIVQEWDAFVHGMNAEQERLAGEEAVAKVKETDTALRAEWKADYDKNFEETKRGYAAFEKVVPGFSELLDSVKVAEGVMLGNDPRMLKIFHAIGKAIGDDFSVPGNPGGEAKKTGDFSSIYKVPNPPRAD
jgi:hypothetical protein